MLPNKHKYTAWIEIIAATVALQKLREWPNYNNEPVILRKDHLLIVEAMQVTEISKHNFPRFYIQLQALKAIAQSFPKGVQFEHVYAHNGDEGNEAADKLATKATGKINSKRRLRSKTPCQIMSNKSRSAYICSEANEIPQKKLLPGPKNSGIPMLGVLALRDLKKSKHEQFCNCFQNAGTSEDTRSSLARFNEQTGPLFSVMQQLNDVIFAEHILEPPTPTR